MANDIVGDAQQIIADLRCELALRTAERDEALAQQTATSEVLQVINASLGELAPVFDAMLDKALSLCGASFGMLRTFDGESFHAVAMKGVPPALQEAWRGPTIPAPGGAQERLVRGERFLHFTDAREDEGYRSGHPTSRALVDLAGARTYLTVPLRQDERLLGSFAIYRQEVRPFSDKQIALPQNFAAQAVIAMENARLLTETQEALEQQTATAEVLQVINASPGDLTPVFDAMLEKALHLCEAVFGGMMVYDGEGFRTVALRGMSTDLAQNGVQRPSPGTGLGRIAAGERLVHIPDLAAEESYFSGDPLRVATVERLGARSCVWAALVKDDRLLGVLMIYRREVAAVLRQADRAVAEFRGAGGYRDGERAAPGRIARAYRRSRRIARIPDRDQ
jgi:GAF domain-containing protein